MHTGKGPHEVPARRQRSASKEEASPETAPAHTMILDFPPPELWENKFCLGCCLKWDILLWQPYQTNTLNNSSLTFLTKIPLSLRKQGIGDHMVWSFTPTGVCHLLCIRKLSPYSGPGRKLHQSPSQCWSEDIHGRFFLSAKKISV